MSWPAPEYDAHPRIVLLSKPYGATSSASTFTLYGWFRVLYRDRKGRRTSVYRETFEDALKVLEEG